MYDKREKYLNDKRSKTTVEQKKYSIRGANTVVDNEKKQTMKKPSDNQKRALSICTLLQHYWKDDFKKWI